MYLSSTSLSSESSIPLVSCLIIFQKQVSWCIFPKRFIYKKVTLWVQHKSFFFRDLYSSNLCLSVSSVIWSKCSMRATKRNSSMLVTFFIKNTQIVFGQNVLVFLIFCSKVNRYIIHDWKIRTLHYDRWEVQIKSGD